MDPPVPPDEADCCKSGCTPCIFDVYEEQLRKYENSRGASSSNKAVMTNCMSQTSYAVFNLVERTSHTRDTLLLSFEYVGRINSPSTAVVYQPGQHFLLRGDSFTRAYTPIPLLHNKIATSPRKFTVLIRLYENGAMSDFIRRLKIGDETLWRGPYGSYTIDYSYQHMLLIAQGTGIAPIYAVIKAMLDNDECETFLRLFFCCRNCDDILLRDELYELAAYWNFSYEVFLTQSDSLKSKYREVLNARRLSMDDLENYLGSDKVGNNQGVQVLICGSERFNVQISDCVTSLGVDSSRVFAF